MGLAKARRLISPWYRLKVLQHKYIVEGVEWDESYAVGTKILQHKYVAEGMGRSYAMGTKFSSKST